MKMLEHSIPGNHKVRGQTAKLASNKLEVERKKLELMRSFLLPPELIEPASLKPGETAATAMRTAEFHIAFIPLLPNGRYDLEGEAVVLSDHVRLCTWKILICDRELTPNELSPASPVSVLCLL